jgi:CheY-like chemotaxis protein
VRLATDVRQAFAAIDDQPFDLLISDIGLPDGSGLDVVKRWHAVNPHAPSIALTGYGMDHDVEQCRKHGFREHITKPVNFDKLESVIRSVKVPLG